MFFFKKYNFWKFSSHFSFFLQYLPKEKSYRKNNYTFRTSTSRRFFWYIIHYIYLKLSWRTKYRYRSLYLWTGKIRKDQNFLKIKKKFNFHVIKRDWWKFGTNRMKNKGIIAIWKNSHSLWYTRYFYMWFNWFVAY